MILLCYLEMVAYPGKIASIFGTRHVFEACRIHYSGGRNLCATVTCSPRHTPGDYVAPSVAIIGTRGYPSYYGGFETAVRRMAPFLIGRGWDVTVYGRAGSTRDDDPGRDWAVSAVSTRGVETKALSTLSYGLTATLHAMRSKPDVALVMNVANGFWLPLLRWRGIPTIVNVDGIEWERAKWGWFARQVFKMGAKMTAIFADELIFDAKEIGRRWHETYGRRGTFIPYGGDATSFPVSADLTSGQYILCVARFVPENTIEEFLDALELVSSGYEVVIVGSSGYGGPLEDRVRSLADKNPHVNWLGHVSDDERLAALWQHAGAYFHGHGVGGTNPALVQAMASGAPIVARDTVYNREVLDDAALFCQPDGVSISQSIGALLESEDLRTRLSTRARVRAEGLYSWPQVNEGYASRLAEHARGTTRSARPKL